MSSPSPLVLALLLLAATASGSEEPSANAVTGEEIQLLDSSGSIPLTECHRREVVHILQHPGCVPKPIRSYACFGTCSSYVQVSTSKFWQVERSCNCCQEVDEIETSITLYCPKQHPKMRKVTTRAPKECSCRPCSAVDEREVKPQEIASQLA